MKKKIGIACIWIAVWFALDALIQNDILFAGPAATLHALAGLAVTSGFWISIGTTCLRILAGFFSGALLGIALASLSVRFPFAGEVLSPFVSVLKSVPVASFVILILIWAGNRNLSYFICMAVVFPIVYISTLSGLRSTDPKLLEMAELFRMPWKNRVRYIRYPALRPHLWSACSTALGMSWKSGVAAEVIGQPLRTVGNELYKAKIYLDTPALFAWTVVIVLLSKVFEKAVLALIERKGSGKETV